MQFIRRSSAALVAVVGLTACTPAQIAAVSHWYQATQSPNRTSIEPCGGGDLPPCYVAERESGGEYYVTARSGCSGPCYGKWQFDPRTWDANVERMGRPDLVGHYIASPADQDAVAAFVWNHGAGCSAWAAC